MAEALNAISEETGALFVVAAGNACAPETIGSPGSAERGAHRSARSRTPPGALSYFSSQGPLAVLGRAEARARRPRQRRHGGPLGRQRRRGRLHRHERHVDGDAARRGRRRDPQAAASRVHGRPAAGARSSARATRRRTHARTRAAAASSTSTRRSTRPSSPRARATSACSRGARRPTPVVRTVEYTNRSADDVVLRRSPAALDGAVRRRARDRRRRRSTIPAGETRSVTHDGRPRRRCRAARSSRARSSRRSTAPPSRAPRSASSPSRSATTSRSPRPASTASPSTTYGILYDVETGILRAVRRRRRDHDAPARRRVLGDVVHGRRPSRPTRR